MHVHIPSYLSPLVVALSSLPPVAVALSPSSQSAPAALCRYLPGDAGFPSVQDWNSLNSSVGGSLILGTPLAHPCYNAPFNETSCSKLMNEWTDLTPYLADPVNVMEPYWTNNSCSPFLAPGGTCSIGNLASYAINVSTVADVIAGVRFAQEKNIRLSIKNTGHDQLGRSQGKGSLALWMANMKSMSFFHYTSPGYTGPAAKVGAGVQNFEVYAAASEQGLRVVGGSCPTVGVTGGFTQGGGHGPLGSMYGLGSDNTLEFEVVTAGGQHITASPTQNEDLYWALSGGGPGNYGVVFSVTVKAHADGPIAGAGFEIANTNPDTFWLAVGAWIKHLLVLDQIPGFNTLWGFNSGGLVLEYATLPAATAAEMIAAFDPFFRELDSLNVTVVYNETNVHPSFNSHYNYWATQAYSTNDSIGGRLVPRSIVQNNLTELVNALRSIATDPEATDGSFIYGIANNVTHARVGNNANSNSVLPAWRDSLFNMNMGIGLTADASWETMSQGQALLNRWQDQLRALTPTSGAYMSESTYDNAEWKSDYFGINYEALLAVKTKYDPNHLFYVNTAVGHDAYWTIDGEGRMCPLT